MHSSLADVFSMKHPNEGLWCIFKPIGDMVHVADFALLQPLQDRTSLSFIATILLLLLHYYMYTYV